MVHDKRYRRRRRNEKQEHRSRRRRRDAAGEGRAMSTNGCGNNAHGLNTHGHNVKITTSQNAQLLVIMQNMSK